MSEIKLLPCPFCGGEAKVHYDYHNFALVQCSGCGIGTLHKGYEKDVIADWNTRKPVDAVLDRLEEEKQNALKLWDNNSRYMGYEHSIKIVKEGLGDV